ncbi:hypothetical protein [Aquisalimonas sp. 2447]|uniref:hypothetical protein n=1 Tax=Aquisalimonas sp. 2447 TaxID=2740807 RepID=UPI0020C22A99|nr:hypothetical protein [Aquisalimonas sp. 2447]
MEQRTFQQAMTYLAAAYSVEMPKEKAAVYWDQLGNLEDEPFWVAVKVAVGNDEWMPSVARLRELYREELRRRRQQPALTRPEPVDREQGREYIRHIRDVLGIRR